MVTTKIKPKIFSNGSTIFLLFQIESSPTCRIYSNDQEGNTYRSVRDELFLTNFAVVFTTCKTHFMFFACKLASP